METLERFLGGEPDMNYTDGIIDDYFNVKKLVEDIGQFYF